MWEFPDFIKLDGSLDGPSGNLKGTAVSGGVAMSDEMKAELLARLLAPFAAVGLIHIVLWTICHVI